MRVKDKTRAPAGTYVRKIDRGCATSAEEHVQERDRKYIDGIVLELQNRLMNSEQEER